ncbi:MAG: SBBP repeat-containing protein [Bryobacteraceae bacterium]|jgi:uncharacterized repeat protein (TIGR01451 family)
MNITGFHFYMRLTAACVPALCLAATQAKVNVDFGKAPLSFEANRGQTDARVDYLSRGRGYTLLLTRDQAVLRLKEGAPLRMKLLGASGQAAASGLEQLPGVANYFRGHDPSKWQTGIPTYQKVKYAGVYPGVDLVYYGNQGRLEHDFIVAAGADPSKILLSFEGAQPRIDRQGDLCLTIDGSELRFQKPVIYQASNRAGTGAKQTVAGRYALDGNKVRFELGAYDHSRELTIDPLLVYSSYLGGSGNDYGAGIAVDSQGSAYVTGYTASTNFPTENPIVGPMPNGSQDAFVSKFNASGTALIYSTYLGGSAAGETQANDIAVDSEFNVYVGGVTNASDYPVTSGAFQTVCGPISGGGSFDVPSCGGNVFGAFLTKINAAGNALTYSTFLGGSYSSYITGVAVDAAGEAYVTGYYATSCYDSTGCYWFPTTAGAAQQYCQISSGQGAWFAFFTKFDAAGATLVYSSLFGSATTPDAPTGSGPSICNYTQGAPPQNSTYGYAIAVDANGDAYITGYTQDGNLPVTAGAFQTSAAPLTGGSTPYLIEGSRGFVAKFDPTQSGAASLIYATYLGGATKGAADQATGIAIDSQFNAYITGNAESPHFPTTPGAFQRTCEIDQTYCSTAFVTKLNPAGSAPVYSTFLGAQASGGGAVSASRIRVNSSYDAFVTGNAGAEFPLMNPIQTAVGPMFVTEFNSTGRALLFSTYAGIGGAESSATSLAVDAKGSVYLTGNTNDIAVTPGAFQQAFGGGLDAFVMKIATVASDLQLTNSAPTSVATGADLTYTITAVNNGPDPATRVTVSDTVTTGSTFVSVTPSAGTCTAPPVGGTGAVVCSLGSLAVSDTGTVTLTVNVTAAVGTILTDTARISDAGYDSATSSTSTVRTKVRN